MINFTADKIGRLDKFIAEKVSVSRGEVQRAIKTGRVSVNGKVILEPDFGLNARDNIELPEFTSDKLHASSFTLQVVYENPDLAVIDKPAGLMVHPAAGRSEETLANALLQRFPGIEKVGEPHRPGIVHRLDEDTSGLLLVAKTTAGYDYLKNLFQTRDIEKEYLALVHGGMEKLHGVIDLPIGKTSTHTKMKAGVGKDAITEYSVIASVDEYTLLLVKLHTGRTHQIRVHLAHLGHPVVGDQLYGQFKKQDQALVDRQFLHAYRLKFKLMDGSWLELISELPHELQSVVAKLRLKH